jgi:hypothetical protein
MGLNVSKCLEGSNVGIFRRIYVDGGYISGFCG